MLKKDWTCAQNMLTILGILVNIIWRGGGHGDLHFDNGQDMHVSIENYEANVYGHDLDLLIILHQLCVSYLTTSGCQEKSV